jgi:hypothetical protein
MPSRLYEYSSSPLEADGGDEEELEEPLVDDDKLPSESSLPALLPRVILRRLSGPF